MKLSLECKYLELGISFNSKKFNRNWVYTEDDLPRLRKKYYNRGMYTTVQRFLYKELPSQIKGTEFTNPMICPLYHDFDNGDIGVAKIQAVRVIKLYARVGLDPFQFHTFFSGSKGYHLEIPYECFGIKPDVFLNKKYEKIVKMIAKKLDIKYIRGDPDSPGALDTGIYDHKRMWRLTNSIHQKSNRYKIPLTLKEIVKWDAIKIRTIACKPREVKIKPPTFQMTLQELEKRLKKE